jgi:hypothetical protein
VSARLLIALLLVVTLASAGCGGCGEAPSAQAGANDQGSPQSGSWSFSSASRGQAVAWSWGDVPVAGAVRLSGPSHGGDDVVTWLWSSRARGRAVRVEGAGASVAAGAPGSVVAAFVASSRATRSLIWECVLLDPSVETWRLGALRGERVTVLWTRGRRALVMCYAGRGGALTMLDPRGRRTLRIRTSGQVATCQVSGDGRRAVVGEAMGGGRYRLDWIEVDWRRGPRVVARTMGRHPGAVLDRVGRLAVLIGSRPQLVRFGSSTGRRLPGAFASAAQVGGGRVLLQTAAETEDGAGTSLRVSSLEGRLLWSRAVPAVVRAHADPRLRWVGYADADSGSGVVVDVASGRAVRLGGCDDVFPVSARLAATVDPGGAIAYRAVPW